LGQQPEAAVLKAAGIDAYLVKPVKQSLLLDRLVIVMGNARLEAPLPHAKPVAPSQASPSSPLPSPARKLRILVAEDNPINQTVALGQLRKLGYTADAVANGLEVLQALQQVPYDIVLMDCQMPEMDGYEAARLIRECEHEPSPALPRTAPIYIIAMTANAMQGDREKCLAAGMDDYVSKPVRTAELQAALERRHQVPSPSASPAPASPASDPDGKKAGGAALAEVPPMDLDRLRAIAGENPESVRHLVGLYLTQADEMMHGLQAAVQSRSAPEITRLAHKLGGSSSTCGMTGIVAPLRNLEQLGSAGGLPESEILLAEANRQLAFIHQFLAARGLCDPMPVL
jgi:CheY-like chemotaxis protein/HPt (histidine-containing phosphotransfer) domain-containing protein